jgi:hypothetical protein
MRFLCLELRTQIFELEFLSVNFVDNFDRTIVFFLKVRKGL